jgi:hypothetical protein
LREDTDERSVLISAGSVQLEGLLRVSDEAEGIEGIVLFAHGGADEQTVALNQYALSQIRAEKKLEIVPGAAHWFAEPGALAEVARLSSQWFKHHLTSTVQNPPHHPAAPQFADRYPHAQINSSRFK